VDENVKGLVISHAEYGETMIATDDAIVPGLQSHSASLDLGCEAAAAFSLLCAVEKWPVWLSFLRSVRRTNPSVRLGVGSEIAVRSWLPGNEEELYEVESFITNYRLSLVGAYSLRRRLEFRVECRSASSRLHARLAYPAYHGRLGTFLDRWQRGRRVASALDDSLVHFKGLVEFKRDEPILADY
jgi:hypothetical protein